MKENVIIHGVMDDGVSMMLQTLTDKGIDASKCFICRKPIVRTERDLRYLDERLKRWWAKIRRKEPEKYYTWNIGAFYHLGVVCDEGSCFVELLDINQADDLLKNLMDTGKSREDAIIWMRKLGYDVSRLREE